MCNHSAQDLTIEFKGKIYSNLTVSENPMVRCVKCLAHGERINGEIIWGQNVEEQRSGKLLTLRRSITRVRGNIRGKK